MHEEDEMPDWGDEEEVLFVVAIVTEVSLLFFVNDVEENWHLTAENWKEDEEDDDGGGVELLLEEAGNNSNKWNKWNRFIYSKWWW